MIELLEDDARPDRMLVNDDTPHGSTVFHEGMAAFHFLTLDPSFSYSSVGSW